MKALSSLSSIPIWDRSAAVIAIELTLGATGCNFMAFSRAVSTALRTCEKAREGERRREKAREGVMAGLTPFPPRCAHRFHVEVCGNGR